MEISTFTLIVMVTGALLIVMALAGSVLKRLPLTASMLYLAAGFSIGPHGLGLINVDPLRDAPVLERIVEVAVLVSLFTAGLKLRTPLSSPEWRTPLRLVTGSMLLTIGLLTLVGTLMLGLPLGAAILLGAVLAPTDPVLASDVQVESATDRDGLRFSLTAEAGLNDGAAFPFVMLGMGLLGLHELGPFGWRWLAVDALWAVAGGIGVGALLGTLIGRLVIYLRREHKEAVGLDDFLSLGLIALSYGGALLIYTYGFLAVFAAGLALRRVERHHTGEGAPEELVAIHKSEEAEEIATDAERAPAYMAQAVLFFNEQLERIGEVAVVVLIGTMLSPSLLRPELIWFVPLLLLVVRPISAAVGLLGSRTAAVQRAFIGWFGIRGIGSIYYLMFAISHGLSQELATLMVSLTLTVVAVSVVVHGITVTPLMGLYGRLSSRSKAQG